MLVCAEPRCCRRQTSLSYMLKPSLVCLGCSIRQPVPSYSVFPLAPPARLSCNLFVLEAADSSPSVWPNIVTPTHLLLPIDFKHMPVFNRRRHNTFILSIAHEHSFLHCLTSYRCVVLTLPRRWLNIKSFFFKIYFLHPLTVKRAWVKRAWAGRISSKTCKR